MLEGSAWINGDRINGSFHLLINGVYWGYNLLTRLLLTSWDITRSSVYVLGSRKKHAKNDSRNGDLNWEDRNPATKMQQEFQEYIHLNLPGVSQNV